MIVKIKHMCFIKHLHTTTERCKSLFLVKPLILRHPEQVLARPIGFMRWFQTEQLQAFLRVEEIPKGRTTRYWLWRVKDIPHAGPELNPGISSSSSQELNSGQSGERRTCYHGATKPLFSKTRSLCCIHLKIFYRPPTKSPSPIYFY